MYSFIYESLTFKLCNRILIWYKNSIVNLIFVHIALCYKFSFLHKVLLEYFTKNLTFGYSKTYKVIRFFAKKLDTQISKLNKAITSKLVYSKSFILSETFKNELKSNFALPLNALLIPFIIGYSILISVKNTWSTQSFLVTSVLILLVAISAFTGKSWKAWFNNSVLYRFYKFIWE